MVERNAGVAPDKRIEFRIGIHLGDVVEESDGDLMGDGVNIAARLQGVASPEGSASPSKPTGRSNQSLFGAVDGFKVTATGMLVRLVHVKIKLVVVEAAPHSGRYGMSTACIRLPCCS